MIDVAPKIFLKLDNLWTRVQNDFKTRDLVDSGTKLISNLITDSCG